jgi:hypothetical protein
MYYRLAAGLKIHPDKAHIALFDIATCKKAIEVINGWGPCNPHKKNLGHKSSRNCGKYKSFLERLTKRKR